MAERDMSLVSVPKWALEFVLERGSFQDEGPVPEGWSSTEMDAAIKLLEAALKAPLMPVYGSKPVD